MIRNDKSKYYFDNIIIIRDFKSKNCFYAYFYWTHYLMLFKNIKLFCDIHNYLCCDLFFVILIVILLNYIFLYFVHPLSIFSWKYSHSFYKLFFQNSKLMRVAILKIIGHIVSEADSAENLKSKVLSNIW